MNLFFSTQIENGTAMLTEEDSGHCIRVLRMTKGDAISFTDGAGNLYSGIIAEAHSKKCMIDIADVVRGNDKKNYSLHIAIAPTKNIDRFEWFLEKATEIGINEITPLICQRSERKNVKTERLNKVLLAAMKQSLRTWLPKMNEAISLENFFNVPVEGDKFICVQEGSRHLNKQVHPSSDVTLLIGPEGDFTDIEKRTAEKNNFLPASLGDGRLRTETAGVVGCTIVSLLNAAPSAATQSVS
jgi:16S rRNA (uracil1498-N3)-methyltransferase